MLLALRVSNLAVIEEVEIAFGQGLTVFTGETGAGKSILVDALSLLLGRRAGPDVIRAGEEEASIEGVFAKGPLLAERLQSLGLPDLGDEVSVRRVVCRNGRGKAYVNGTLVTAGVLAGALKGVVDISGQHDYMSLFDRSQHRALLDRIAGIEGLKISYRDKLDELKLLKAQLEGLGGSEEELQRRSAFLRFELDELDRFILEPGQCDQLEEERKRLVNSEKLRCAVAGAESLLRGEEGSIIESLRKVGALISDAGRLDRGLQAPEERLKVAFAEVEEVARALSRYGAGLETNPERLAEIDDRLDGARRLCRKHGCAIAQLAERRENLADELSRYADRAKARSAVEERLRAAEKSARALGGSLFAARLKAAKELSGKVEKGLRELAMSGASFEVRVVESDGLGLEGMDEVELLFSANPGEASQSLADVASGGEASRVLLALKRAVSQSDPCGCYVLDEADGGLGGAAAEVVGRMIKEVSAGYQVLCVTHLAQVAAYADQHLLVVKRERAGRSSSTVTALDDRQARAGELARILSGVDISREALGAAEALIRSAARAGRARSRARLAASGSSGKLRHSA